MGIEGEGSGVRIEDESYNIPGMGFRTFRDRAGQQWEIRPVSRDEWEFSPAGDNSLPARTVAPPGYETDPYELSVEELQRLFEHSLPRPGRKVKNPFGEQ